MRIIVSTIILFLISAILCSGQSPQKYTPIKELIQERNNLTFYIKAHFAEIQDTTKLVIFVEEDEFIIPVKLQKKDLGAVTRFLALGLKKDDVVVVKGVLDDIPIDNEIYKGLVDADIIDEKDMLAAEILDVPPRFRGGDANAFSAWVNSQLTYPKIAKENGIQGRVTLQFTIEPNGKVTNVKVLRGVEESLNEEAVRVVSKSPRWKPGYLDGNPVRVTYTFPVIFQLR